jgi:hypothetical protein
LVKDFPNGNTPQSNLVHYDFHKLKNDKVDTCTMRLIGSPQGPYGFLSVGVLDRQPTKGSTRSR